MDAGTTDAGGANLDAGPMGDAGFVCQFPDIPAPPDASVPPCELGSVEAEGQYEGVWNGRVFGELTLTGPFDLNSGGDVSFEVVCGGDKLLIAGQLQGTASAPDGGPQYPFSGRLYGEFNEATGEVQMVVDPATLTVAFITGTFRVSLTGERQANGAWEGPWCGVSVSPPGGNGFGTWSAAKIMP